jgi:hypothetical protein
MGNHLELTRGFVNRNKKAVTESCEKVDIAPENPVTDRTITNE